MYRITIKNFISANNPGTLDYSEALFDTSEYQYDEFDRTVIEPVVKEGLNKSGSLEFTVTPQNPYYDRIRIIKTIFSVWIDNVMVFRGRTISMTDDIYRQRKIFCEGELAYLNDSLQPPVKEITENPSVFFRSMITDHNSQMNLFSNRINPNEDKKLFTPGSITVNDQGLSWRRISGTGEIVITDENGDYTISGSDEIIAQFSWEIGKIDLSTGEDSNNDEDNRKYIRSISRVSVKKGSIVKAGGGYRCIVVMYRTNSIIHSGVITGTYDIPDDCDIRIFFRRDEDDAEPFEVADLATAPHEALILSGLSMETIVQKSGDMTMTPFNSTNYRNTLDAIESDLLEVYGGYISVRYDGNTRYIDYTSDPPHSGESQRVISFGVNLQEVSKEINGEDVYSILLPTGESNLLMEQAGSNKMITNTQSIYAFPENAIETYGPIFKTQAFSGISKRDELANYAGNYIDKTYHGAAATYTIKAVDMHFVDPSHPLIRAGSKCRITLWPSQIIQNRTCTEATFELQAPENNEYVFENVSDERNSLTSKYKKEKKASSRGGYGVSTSPTTEDKGAGDEDTIIRSNGNIILYPGAEKMVSIPLAKTFLAPSLTEWSLGPIKYKAENGLKIGDKAEIDQNLLVKGKAIIGSSADVFSQMGAGTSLFVNGGIHGKNIRGSTLIVGSTGLGNDGQFRIMKAESNPGSSIYMPVQLQMMGKTTDNQDVVLAGMWVLGDHDVNFNIADTQWFKDRIVAAHNEIEVAEYTWDINKSNPDITDNDIKFSVKMRNLKLGFVTRNDGAQPVYEVTRTYDLIGPEYINLRLFKNQSWDYDDDSDVYSIAFGIRTAGQSGSAYTVTLVSDRIELPALKAAFASHSGQTDSWWHRDTHQYVIPAYTANVYMSTDSGNEHPLLNNSITTGDITIVPSEAIQYGETLTYPTNVILSDSVSSSGTRLSNANVYYKGPDTAGGMRTISNVDVTDIYNDGKASGSRVSTYYVPLTVTFNDGHTGTYLSNCANIWNQGADDAAPPSYDYVYVYAEGNTNGVNMRTGPSSGASRVGLLYCNTQVNFISYSNGYAYVSYEGYTGYVSCSDGIDSNFVWSTPKAGVSVVTSGWKEAPGGGGGGDSDVYIWGVYSAGYSGSGRVLITYENGTSERFNVYYSMAQVTSMSGHDGTVANKKASSAMATTSDLRGRIIYVVYTDRSTKAFNV